MERALFDKVQVQLASQARRRGQRKPRAVRSPLTGRIFDATGVRMSPTFAIGARGKRYRYYVSASLQRGIRPPADRRLRRVAGDALEHVIAERLRRIEGGDPEAPYARLLRVEVRNDQLLLDLPSGLQRAVAAGLSSDEHLSEHPDDADWLRLAMPNTIPRRGGATTIAEAVVAGPQPNPKLIRALREAHAMLERDPAGQPLITASPASPYQRRLVKLAFLAPTLQAAILSGRHPPGLTLARLLAADIPIAWDAQMRRFGQGVL